MPRARIAVLYFLCVCAVVAAIAISGSIPATAMESPGTPKPMARAAWWPLAKGPFYGDLAPNWDKNPRAIYLQAGTFDTRDMGLDLPSELTFGKGRAAAAWTPWIVQLAGPITEAKKDALRERGVKLYTYVPQNAFVVRAADPSKLAAMPGVLWAAPYHPAYRIEPLMGTTPTFDPVKAANRTIYVRAWLFEASDRDALIAALGASGAVVDRDVTFDPHGYKDAVYFEGTPRQILSAAARDEIRWIEEITREGFTMNAESHVVLQSGHLANGTPLWDAGVDGSKEVVGDMDSGMDVDTILLANTATDAGTCGPTHRKCLSYTPFGGGDMLTCGNYTHGTNTAQCAVGNGSDLGIDSILDGVAKHAKIVFQDIQQSTPLKCALGALDAPATFVAMYDQVRSFGGHLTNGSFSACSAYGSYANEADQYTWDHKDFLMTFSAGNGGNGLVCPGTAKNVIAAGGFYQDPFFDFFGSTGPSESGRMGPTVMGPACDHSGGNPAPYNYDTSTSVQSADTDITGVPDNIISQGACGTSFSSPYSMGAAALVRDYFEKGFYPSGSASTGDAFAPTGALVKAVLLTSGDLMTCCGSFMTSTSTYGQGMGRIDLARVLHVSGDARTVPALRVVDKGAAAGLATGGVYTETVDISDTTIPLRATVNWADRPGTALVNNLRLTVIGPAGGPSQTYHGGNFNLDVTKSEAAGGTNDDGVNPFESAFVSPSELVTGTWTIRVDGTNVPSGDPNFGNTQPFALVIAGGFAPVVREVSPDGSAFPLVETSVSGPNVSWQWESISGAGVVYDFYRGTLTSLEGGVYNHAKIDSAHCGLVTNSTTVSDRMDGVDAYYLVGMRNGSSVGSLGKDSAGNPRPAASPACP